MGHILLGHKKKINSFLSDFFSETHARMRFYFYILFKYNFFLLMINSKMNKMYRSYSSNQLFNPIPYVHIQWIFNPPQTPHVGGAWERLVRSVKDVMYRLLKDTVLKDAQLLTLLTEAESVVNSCPLTYLSDDPGDLTALTQSHPPRRAQQLGVYC